MPRIHQAILAAIADGQFVVSDHADNQIRDRSIAAWQVIEGAATGKLLSERPETKPNPSVELQQLLADGTPVKAVWSFVENARFAKLVTVHFFDR